MIDDVFQGGPTGTSSSMVTLICGSDGLNWSFSTAAAGYHKFDGPQCIMGLKKWKSQKGRFRLLKVEAKISELLSANFTRRESRLHVP